ncbi:MAG: division/cell wall cluster transcriptional repressor MraZ [Candidatus Omnitrophica bacterium]|nr:division/cell wall cluster transcriptional repressor MraZ [Candidatus Omnitrophota bacterium]MDD4940313.1 division/cell wall cluster transcriptional repressor MraZ [Candidatus Omnitrophota bacterium]MDD5775185.1 division/cell wall cluster transcriptional repressor MraZ [Candidatus Omnitrophota bacterium]HNQ51473.1 division/cell wall cluster transcriptional repressor MraZ [Candidatus Omnitrophota bacterium]HQO38565.1 division/cell wall cluster transcriptional repressor MraZ [Candidatus Omnitr
MFYGEFFHSIDRKGRLILPSKFREAAKANFVEKFFVTRGLDTCLFMFSEEEWRSQETKFKAMPFTKQESRVFNRLYFSGAVDVIPDRQGRILLPQFQKDYAQIKKDVVIVGVSNRIEIWGAEKWKEFFGTWKQSFEEIAEKLVETQ